MEDKSLEISKIQDVELSNISNIYEKPEALEKSNQILVQDLPNNENKPISKPNKPFMPIPKRIILLSLILFIIGTAFLASGLVDYWKEDRERGIAFIVFGSLMFIPGLFYTYQVYLACIADTPEERMEILEDIPQIEY